MADAARIETVKAAATAGVLSEDRADIVRCGGMVVLLIADGAGGLGGGARAAELGLALLREAALAATFDLRSPQAWCQKLDEVDQRLEADSEAGETTVVVVTAWPGGIAGASVGDSGAWWVREQSFDDLTCHQEPRPRLGTGRAVPTGFEAQGCGGTLLLATDGLLRYARPASICAQVRGADLAVAAEALVALVRLPSGAFQDDVALLLCRRG